jgi:hypothetical protein
MSKIDISSTALEKGIEIAKGFVEKLIYPSAEEMGLLFKDSISKWRFHNQIKTLVNAKSICEKHGVNPKIISPKLLCPLLEYAGLEDNEKLQDKWATLLANMVDSDQNVENHVFPYLLSQVSIQEFEILENTFELKVKRVIGLSQELEEFMTSKVQLLSELNTEIAQLEIEFNQRRENNINNPKNYQNLWNLQNKISELKSKKSSHEKTQIKIKRAIAEAELIASKNLRDFEVSNLVRLGVAKEIVRTYGYMDSARVSVTKGPSHYESDDYVNLDDLTVTIETDKIEYELTELGELFVKACQERNKYT